MEHLANTGSVVPEMGGTSPHIEEVVGVPAESSGDQVLARLSQLQQLAIFTDVQAYEIFASGVREVLNEPPPLVEEQDPHGNAKLQTWARSRLATSAVAVEKILSVEDIQRIPHKDQLIALLHEAEQLIVAEGLEDPEWCGRLCGTITNDEHRLFLAREASARMMPEFPADTLAELQTQPDLGRVAFFHEYFATRKTALSEHKKIEYIDTVPLRTNMELKLYLNNPNYTKDFFRDTHKFSDGAGAQSVAMMELNTEDRLYFFGDNSTSHPWQERCIYPGVVSGIENYEDGRFLVRHAPLIDQSVEDTVISVLKKNKGFSGLNAYHGVFGAEFAEKAKAEGFLERMGRFLQAFKPDIRETVAHELLKTSRGTANFFEGLTSGGLDDTVFSEDLFFQAINKGNAYDVLTNSDHFPKMPFSEVFARVRGNSTAVEGLLPCLWQLEKDARLSRDVLDTFIDVCGLANVVQSNMAVFDADAQNALVRQALADKEAESWVLGSLGYCSELTLSTAEYMLQVSPQAVLNIALSIRAFTQKDQSVLIGRVLDQAPELRKILLVRINYLHELDVECCRKLLSSELTTEELTEAQRCAHAFVPQAQSLFAEKLFALSREAFTASLATGYAQDVIPASIADALVESGQCRWVVQYKSFFQANVRPDTKKRLDAFDQLIKNISASPSRTVRRMETQLIDGLMDADDPEAAYARIEAVFLRNHIPLAGKTLLAFETIYGQEHYRKAFPPTLKEASPRESRMLIYRDLLNIHIDSGNPSLRLYLEDIQRVALSIHRVKSGEEVTEHEQKQILSFLRKVAVLHSESMYGQSKKEPQSPGSEVSIQERIHGWEQSLGVREGQSLQDRLAEMFLLPAGVGSIQEALDRMDTSKKIADTENRLFAEKTTNGKIQLQDGDLLKGVESRFLVSYLQNGNVCKELLGHAAKSDCTPLDTDLERMDAVSISSGVAHAYKNSLANSYGDMALVFRPKPDRFVRTEADQPVDIRQQLFGSTYKYELFTSGELGDRHEGIRTGVPFTEVRAIIMKDDRRRSILDLKMDIVANGYYVPITDIQGKILFSPQEYDELKTLYAGTEANRAMIPNVDRSVLNTDQREQIEAIREQLVGERESLQKIKTEIERKIQEALRAAGVSIRTSGELAVGAEIHNTGSTARGTSIPGAVVDFDIAIRLDETDLTQHEKISSALDAILVGKTESGAPNQWRRSGIEVQGKLVDIDVTYASKPEVEGIPSHTIMEQRLQAIERLEMRDADLVRANIIFAKQVLKKSGVYKKLDGGLGGLGVENWILQHGGSFAKAREMVLRAAIDDQGAVRSFDDCAARYAIPDPGVNLISESDDKEGEEKRVYRHDNFFYFLNRDGSNGYAKFIQALQHMGA